MYSSEIEVEAPRSLVLEFVRDPFIVAGVFGHVAILRVKDKVKGDFVTPEYLEKPENSFKVAYIYGVPPDYKVFSGIFEGPKISVDAIEYSGYTDDGKIKFTLSFILKNLASETRIYMNSEFKFEGSFLDKMLGRGSFDMAKHIIEGHFMPYIKFYFDSHKSSEVKIGKRIILQDEGDMNYIITKFKEVARTMNNGIIEVYSENLNCSFGIINNNMKRSICRSGKDIKTDTEALTALLFSTGKGKIIAYEVNLEDAIISQFA
ncbi:hypothetical protein [Acidianus manzaensis]|uniref:Uncharacterized protein n=1 Tax=Acidianus manzaensis TaxID=282676 RepID=A0A1W6JYZ9_9CREN|nr:hypothetical protein [Acidianus manzaensis]ARM75424.1 hypothetical protein B6F84_04860 [Acidianus manzaensis]